MDQFLGISTVHVRNSTSAKFLDFHMHFIITQT